MDKKQQKKSVSPAPKAVTKAKSPAKVSKEVASSPKTAKSAASPKAAATKASPAPATPAPLKYADIDVQQVKKAVAALQKHQEIVGAAKGAQLFDNDKIIHLQIVLNKIPGRAQVKPISVFVPLANPIYKESELCVFVKDPVDLAKKFFKTKDIANVKKIIGVQKLRNEMSRYEARRKLLNSYDMFLCDDRITLVLPRFLGKDFIKSKKTPIPIVIGQKNLTKQVEKVVNSTHFSIGVGSVMGVAIGRISQTPEQVAQNVKQSIKAIVEQIPKKWKNVKEISIKTSDSIALPIYNNIAPLQGPSTKKRVRDDSDEDSSEDEELIASFASKKAKQSETVAKATSTPAKKTAKAASTPSKTPEKAAPSANTKKQTPEKKGVEAKPATPKSAEKKSDSKPTTPKTAEKKAESKPATPKAAEKKAESKPATPKTAEKKSDSKPTTPKTAEKKAESKPATPKAVEKADTKATTPKAATPKADKKTEAKPATPKKSPAKEAKPATPTADKAAAKTPKTPKTPEAPAEKPKAATPKSPKSPKQTGASPSSKKTGSAKKK